VGFLSRLLGRRPLAATPPPRRSLSVCAVHAGSLVPIVGESYRQAALGEAAARATDASPYLDELRDYALEAAQAEPGRRWFRAVLLREPDNPDEPAAVAVHAEGGGHLGYLSREHAAAYGRVFESLAKRGYDGAACPAMLTGGAGHKSYGVVLALSSPGYVMGDLHAEEREAARVERASAKEERGRAIYEAALAGQPWETIAAAHGYASVGGAHNAARAYAERHGLELPRRARGPRPKSET
jgi:hypothetical protein